MTTEDMMGGEWEQHARHLYVESTGWIRGHYVPGAIGRVRTAAQLADQHKTKGAYHDLERALANLEVEIQRYQHRMDELAKEVGYLHALVLRARDEAPHVEPVASEWSVLGPDEDEETWLARNRNLYR